MTRAPVCLETSPKVAVSTEQVALQATLVGDVAQPVLPPRRRRLLSPSSSRALEVLGHAIEYLADEYALHAGNLPLLDAEDPQLHGIQLLMAASRSVYWDCPLAPTLREHVSRLLSRCMHALQLVRTVKVIEVRRSPDELRRKATIA
jgi:hypothetical protein